MDKIETPFNYTGSKYKMLEKIIPLFDITKTHFIDLFAGGGSVYTNVLDEYEKVLVNDIIGDLIRIQKSLLESDYIIEITKEMCVGLKENKEKYLDLRKAYNENPTPAKLWALMLSCNSNLMRFNKKFKFNQTWGKRTWNPNTSKKVEKFIDKIRKNSEKIHFSSVNFNELNLDNIKLNPNKIMIYCDPPYSNTEAGYNCYWNKDDDMKLYNYLKKADRLGCSWALSGSLRHGKKESELLNKMVDEYNVIEIEFNYKKISKKNKETQEVLIKNY